MTDPGDLGLSLQLFLFRPLAEPVVECGDRYTHGAANLGVRKVSLSAEFLDGGLADT